MPPVIDSRLRALAEVMVRVGVNLQPGQSLLITDPYELQGIQPETEPLVAAIRNVAEGNPTRVIPADPSRLRTLAETDNLHGYEALVSGHLRQLDRHLEEGGAFLFLQGSQPQLMAGLPAERLARLDHAKWRHLGPLIQRLVRGATQWTLAPAPTSSWAEAAYPEIPAVDRLPALWQSMFAAFRIGPELAAVPSTGRSLPANSHPGPDPISAWHTHLAALARCRDGLNATRHRRIRYVGPGTDLTLDLPRSHAWCTAQLVSKAGVPYVANLPTQEVFTAPHKNSANGIARVARPVVHGGAVIEGIELEFRRGRVVSASARTGQDTLLHLLATDAGAGRIGEVAMVDEALFRSSVDVSAVDKSPSGWPNHGRLFRHTLFDENAGHHIALGAAYPFCSRSLLPLALNHSQIHLDLPLEAEIELE